MKLYKIILLLILLSGFAYADNFIPKIISYQGYLTNKGNDPLSGTYTMSFTIYNSSSNNLWDETGVSIVVDHGLFSYELGGSKPLNLSGDKQYYLEVVINGETLSGRANITQAMWSQRAQQANNLTDVNNYVVGNLTVNDNLTVGGDIITGLEVGDTNVSIISGIANINGNEGMIFQNTNEILATNQLAAVTTFPFVWRNGAMNLFYGVSEDDIFGAGAGGKIRGLVLANEDLSYTSPWMGMYAVDFENFAGLGNSGFTGFAEYSTENGIFIATGATGVGSRHVTIGTSRWDNSNTDLPPSWVLLAGNRTIVSRRSDFNNPTLELQNNGVNKTDILGTGSSWSIGTGGNIVTTGNISVDVISANKYVGVNGLYNSSSWNYTGSVITTFSSVPVKIPNTLMLGSATAVPSGLMEMQSASPFIFLQDTDSSSNLSVAGIVGQNYVNQNIFQIGKLDSTNPYVGIQNLIAGANVNLLIKGPDGKVGVRTAFPTSLITLNGTTELTDDLKVAGDVNITKNLNVSGNLSVVGDLYSNAWINYTDSSTVMGWSTFTVKDIFYKKVGNLIFVSIDIRGVSNDIASNFTLPFTPVSNMPTQNNAFAIVQDNSVGLTTPGFFNILPNNNLVACYKNTAGAKWTASGNKYCIGQFWYEAQ